VITAAASRLRVFSLRELVVHRRRTIATVAVMAVSALYLVAVFGIFGSITGSVNRLTDGIAGIAALEVSGTTDAGFPDTITAEAAAVPGVAAAAPMIRTSAVTPAGRVLLLGADTSSAALQGALKDAVRGAPIPAAPGEPNAVRVGPGVGYRDGQRFQLGSEVVSVASVLTGKSLAQLNGGQYVLAALPLAQNITGRPGRLDSILLTLKPGADPGAVRAAVTAAVGGRAIVADPSLRAARAGDGVKLMNYMALMGAAVALVVGAFLIYTTVSMAITARRPVIATLRAVGGRRGVIVGDMLLEAAILGLIGGAIGSGIGIAVGDSAIGRLPPAVTQGLEARVEYWLPGYAIPVALVATVVAGVGASAMAARQVYKVSPIEALAPVGVSEADRVSRRLRIASGVGAAAGFAAAILVVQRHGSFAFAAVVVLLGAEIATGFVLRGPIVAATAATARVFGSVVAAATITRAPRRVWATVMTVLIAVVTSVVIMGTSADMISSARALFVSVADVDVWVSADAPDSYPTDRLPGDLVHTVAAVPGVARVVEGAFGFAVVGGTRVMLDGFAAGSADPLYRALDQSERAAVLDGRGVVLTQNLGAALGVRAGDRLQLQTPSGPREVEVLTLVPYFSTVIGTIGIGLKQVRAWFDDSALTVLQITAKPGTDRRHLLDDVRQVVPVQHHVYDGAAALAGLQAPLHQSMFIANAVWGIAALVAAVALFNTLTLSVLERRREIGVLRAMGAGRRFTVRMVLAEAAGIGVVGGVCGLVFGLIDQWLYSVASADIMNFDVTFRPGPMPVACAAGAVLVCLLGALAPARRAVRLNIIEAVGVE
jgi:putative ABC transport system permease protein